MNENSSRGEGCILIVEDSAAMRSYIRTALEGAVGDLEIIEAGDGLSGFKMLVKREPQLVLCDLQMPDFDGMKLLRLRAARVELVDIPIVMLTAEHEAERKVEVLEAGAADYITKPFHKAELVARVRVHLRLKSLKDELRLANTKLEALAKTDALTGIGNRLSFDQFLLEELQRTARYRTPLSLVLMDIDHFKGVNDTYGHLMGDQVLRGIGKSLRGLLRSTDRACRYGGEEFAVLLPHTDLKRGAATAERLRHEISGLRHQQGQSTLQVTVSMGVACVDQENIPASTFISRADTALYAAKNAGRNRVMLHIEPARKTEPAKKTE